jgi:hypothetical protein
MIAVAPDEGLGLVVHWLLMVHWLLLIRRLVVRRLRVVGRLRVARLRGRVRVRGDSAARLAIDMGTRALQAASTRRFKAAGQHRLRLQVSTIHKE